MDSHYRFYRVDIVQKVSRYVEVLKYRQSLKKAYSQWILRLGKCNVGLPWLDWASICAG